METIQQQIGALQVIVAKQQVSVKRQRFAIIALAGIIIAGGFIAAVRPVGDATFDTITCKEWKVVDGDGKERIAAFTNPSGNAGVKWRDKDEKLRILASTSADGNSAVAWLDTDGKLRINASTLADGFASVALGDNNEKIRIAAATLPDGTVCLPTEDRNPLKKP